MEERIADGLSKRFAAVRTVFSVRSDSLTAVRTPVCELFADGTYKHDAQAGVADTGFR